MSDIVTRLRDWRSVHLARLHLLMDEAADEMERLRADWPEQLDAAHSEIERLRLTDVERSAVERAVKDETEHGLVYTADRLQSMLDRLSGGGDCPASDNAAHEDNNERLAALQALTDLDEELSLPRRTHAANPTPSEGIKQNRCTLTDGDCPDGSLPVAWAVAIGNEGLVLDGIFLRKRDADEACAWRNEHTEYGARLIPLCAQSPPTLTDSEREAVEWCVEMALNSATDCVAEVRTLRGLLKRIR